jgi:hypothetical protein
MPKLGDDMDCNGYKLKAVADPVDANDAVNKSYADSLVPVPPAISYTHNQGVPAATWSVAHNLGFYPNVTVVDSSGSSVIGDVQYTDSNNLIITFSGGFSGYAYLS